MSDTLREPIARALWERDMVGLHDLTGRFDEQDPRDLEGYFDAADAVLSVLHEAGEQGDGSPQPPASSTPTTSWLRETTPRAAP